MRRHEDLIARYENGIHALASALRGIPEDLLDHEIAPGKWTVRQIVAHLGDAELVACARFRWIAAEPGSPLQSFDQDKWAVALGYQQQSPGDILQMFTLLRRVTAAMLRSLPESAWTQTGVHEERGTVSLEQMVELCTSHAEHHAEQIKQTRAKLAPAD